MYAIYVYSSSGAYYGVTVLTVEGLVAADHREFRVDKYWQHLYSKVESR